MSAVKWARVLAVLLTFNASAADVTGHWKVVYAGPSRGPKTVGSIVLDLKSEGASVTGTVKIGVWPGEAPVADAKLEGDHLTFTATGHLSSTSGIPTCRIDATINGDEMVLTLTAVRNGGGPLGPDYPYAYKGGRSPQ